MSPAQSIALLRERYLAHLASKVPGPREGSVAGKQTRRGMRQGRTWSQMSDPTWQALALDWQARPDRVFIWSDHHLGHDNIIKHTNRPFGCAVDMDAKLLANAQDAVSQDDWLIFVGDLAMWHDPPAVHDWMAACPGRKVLVLGNHDMRGRGCPASIEQWQELGFLAVADVACLPPTRHSPTLWLTHYPLPIDLIPAATVNVHGHTHRHLMGPSRINVCVEHTGYRPVRLRDLI